MARQTMIADSGGDPAIQPTLTCSIGVSAYNEERNIGQLLESLLRQQASGYELEEIIALAGGCTDRIEDIAREFAARDLRISPLIQPWEED